MTNYEFGCVVAYQVIRSKGKTNLIDNCVEIIEAKAIVFINVIAV